MIPKSRAIESLYSLLDVSGDMTTEDKTEVLSAFLTSVCKSQTNYPQGTPHPDLEIWEEEQNKAPTVQVKTVRNLLPRLDCHMSMKPDGIHSVVPRELAEVPSHFLPSISVPGQAERSHPNCRGLILLLIPDLQVRG